MAQTAQLRLIQTAENEAQRIFKLQREAYMRHAYPTFEERKASLTKVEKILIKYADAIADAVCEDFGHRSAEETKMLEIFNTVDGIRFTRKKIAKWMRPQKRHVGITFAGGKNRVIAQPKGVVGIVSPWNYPLFLAMSPLTSALGAGNRAMIKMAANSQTLCRLLHDLFKAEFDEDQIAILPGVRGSDFTTLPFDHIVFTGSAQSGRTVMAAAAENLTPVTLELGGKSPTIICDDFDISTAADRILYAKFVNAGQTCLAPDYVMLPEGKKDEFAAAAKKVVSKWYPDTNSTDYTSIIDEKSYKRLRDALEDARAKGAEIVPLVPGAEFNDQYRKFPPHLVLNPTEEMTILQEEIFGPLLPVKTYKSLDEVLSYVTERDRPLGLYIFTHDKQSEEKLLMGTVSGGVTVNNCVFHIAQHDMPFGGVGASGMGHYHGYEGFAELSKLKPVHTTPMLDGTKMFHPPYTAKHSRLFKLLLTVKR
ncbi:MAG: coniferyl aldehyde dehydrogenase [Candidatus Binatia bacterium]